MLTFLDIIITVYPHLLKRGKEEWKKEKEEIEE